MRTLYIDADDEVLRSRTLTTNRQKFLMSVLRDVLDLEPGRMKA